MKIRLKSAIKNKNILMVDSGHLALFFRKNQIKPLNFKPFTLVLKKYRSIKQNETELHFFHFKNFLFRSIFLERKRTFYICYLSDYGIHLGEVRIREWKTGLFI